MKKFILSSATVLFIGLIAFAQDPSYGKKWYITESDASGGLSQNLRFEVRGKYSCSVKKEKLNTAKLISDFIPGYPSDWVINYVSVELSATGNGKDMKAVSVNDVLSAEQKNILNTVDLGTEIVLDVKYKNKNAATDNIDIHKMHVAMMVVPEIEAEYVGGYQQLAKYLRESVISKISETTALQSQRVIVIFTVNEQGEIVNAKISRTSGDTKTDKLLVEAINKMPKWKPAENSKGVNVKQEFEFNVGNGGC